MYGRIGRELSTIKFWNLVKRSIRFFTVNNLLDYRKQFKRSARNWSIERALCSITTTLGRGEFTQGQHRQLPGAAKMKVYVHFLKTRALTIFVEVIKGWVGYSSLPRAPSSVNSALTPGHTHL